MDAREAVAAATVPLASLGGIEALVASTERYVLHAGVQQRRLQRFLDGIGDPGRIAFDPYARSLTLRGHHFEADFIGSMGGPHWLWAWANAYLPLTPEQTAASRRVRATGLPLATAGGILCDGIDPMFVVHRLAALAVGASGADAYYVANHSQLYAIAAGGVETQATPMDLWGAIHDALYDPLDKPLAAIGYATERLGGTLHPTDEGVEVRLGEEWLRVRLEEGRIAGIEATL